MNHLVAKVVEIQNTQNLHIVEFDVENNSLYMMSLELADLTPGMKVKLAIKPMSIAIAKRFSGSISYSNKLFATIKSIDIGELLCSIKVDFNSHELEAVMSKRAIHNMNLAIGDTVVLFIKASDIFIKECL